jgi:ribosomal protein S27AE
MAEEKRGQKWEAPGKPEGEGGMSTPESSEQKTGEVAGRGKSDQIICYNCGSGFSMPNSWTWFTCWKCGALNYNPTNSLA